MQVSDIKRPEPNPLDAEMRRVNCALRLSSAANKWLATTPDVVAWLTRVCNTAIEVGGYQMAWVGFAEADENKAVRPVAQAGFDLEYLENLHITWKDEPHGRGPTGIAIRTGTHSIARNIPDDPTFDPWRDEVTKYGYRSSIAVPLAGNGRTFGALSMYSDEFDAFGPKEIEVLRELADDLAYGLIVVFHIGIQRQSLTEALAESQRSLQQAERISRLARWDHDLKTDALVCSEELYRILGLDPHKRNFRFPEFVKLIHPDDRAAVIEAAAGSLSHPGSIDLDYRIIRPDGQLRFIHAEGEIVRDNAGQPLCTIGFLQDVTEKQRAKIALEDANQSLERKNAALEEILSNIHAERDKLGQQINKNVTESILPMLHSLKQGVTRRQQRAIDQIDHSLQEIISPFMDKIAHAVKTLTPTELRVCNLVKRGLPVKQIAELEHVSPETIASHRRSIRQKLQIANRKINLTTYLRDVYCDSPPDESPTRSGISST